MPVGMNFLESPAIFREVLSGAKSRRAIFMFAAQERVRGVIKERLGALARNKPASKKGANRMSYVGWVREPYGEGGAIGNTWARSTFLPSFFSHLSSLLFFRFPVRNYVLRCRFANESEILRNIVANAFVIAITKEDSSVWHTKSTRSKVLDWQRRRS